MNIFRLAASSVFVLSPVRPRGLSRAMMPVMAAALVISLAMPSWSGPNGVDVAPIVKHLERALPSMRDLIRKRDAAPEPGILTYWDRRKYQRDLDRALDAAFRTLVPDHYAPARKALLEFDEAIALGRREVSEMRVASLGAPSDAALSLVDRALRRDTPSGSRQRIEADIARVETEVEEALAARQGVIDAFRSMLVEAYGVEIDSRQAEAALYQVNGTAIVDTVVATRVLLDVEERLREFLSLGIDPAVATRYYGVSAINRLIVLRMHERHVASYETEWLPALDALARDNASEIAAITNSIDSTASPSNLAAMRANLAVRERMADVIKRYKVILENRLAHTWKALESAQEDAEVALYTLRTLESARELGALYADSVADFSALSRISPPDLLPLDDDAVLEQFIDISREIGGTS